MYNKQAVIDMYAKNDLGAESIFQGDFINFGYWKGVNLEKRVTLKERQEASKALYQAVYNQFLSARNLNIAEVGCGRGVGCGILGAHENVSTITGIDLNKKQIDRAKRVNKDLMALTGNKLTFQQGSGADTGLDSATFDIVYSVEASQHFPSFLDYAKEAQRILKPGGKFIINTFFATPLGRARNVEERFSTGESGVNNFRLIEEVKRNCQSIDLSFVSETSIGKDVFYGFNKWNTQLDKASRAQWVTNLQTSFEEGLIDYTILSFQKK
ncbi:MAG: class I SAM-dependent methyltransferase [Saprospiraceae bacterium]